MSAKMNKIAVFFLFMAFAFILSVSTAVSQLPVTIVCNSSNNFLSNSTIVSDYNVLATLLRGGNSACPFIINAYPFSASNQQLGTVPYTITPDVTLDSTTETYKTCNDVNVCTKSADSTSCNPSCCDDSSLACYSDCSYVLERVCQTMTRQIPGGSTIMTPVEYDLDTFWASTNVAQGANVSKIRFVFDPFVTLNDTSSHIPAFWNFHQGCNGDKGCQKTALTCEAKAEPGSVNSTTECLEYFISPKFASCNADINGNFKCCGDDDIIDPGFEAGAGETNLDVWQAEGETCKFSSYCSKVGNVSHTGSQSFKMLAGTSDSSNLSQQLSLPQETYYLSFWVKGVNALPLTATIAGKAVIVPAGSYEWKNYVINFTLLTPLDLTLKFTLPQASTGYPTVWIDDVHILSKDKTIVDYGKVFTSTNGEETAYPNLCYFNNTIWAWMDPIKDQFKILPVDGFDVISNSVWWSACNANGMAGKVYAEDENIVLTQDHEILKYEPSLINSTVITPGGLPSGGDIYETGANTLLIPDKDFEPGIGLFPQGGPDHCSNNLTDGGESDLNCGDGCRKCFIGEMCNSSEDCYNGNCQAVQGLGVKICALPIQNPNDVGYVAQRFICSNMDEVSTYTECCGYSLALCKNTDRSKIRRAGNPLFDVFEFFPLNPTDSKNYVLLMGLPELATTYKYYNYPLQMKKADNPVYNWEQYSYIEFYIASAIPDIKYLRLLILNESPAAFGQNTTLDNYLNSGSNLFSGYILPYATGQQQSGKWLRVRIPLSLLKSRNNVRFISVFANISEVPINHVTHSAFGPNQLFRNVIAIDRINLISSSFEPKYCGKYPPGSNSGIIGQWFGDMDQTQTDVSEESIGMGICENTPGFGWTGTECCGNDLTSSSSILNPTFVAESYADTVHGCVKGFTLGNDSIMNVSFESSAAIKNTSLMFYNSRFYTCNNPQSLPAISTELAYSGTPDVTTKYVSNNILDINTSGQYAACYNQGSWYCDFDTNWKNKSAINNQIINSSVNLSNLNSSNPPKACCPEGWCFYGNTSAPSSCVPSQSSIFQYQAALGIPYFFNSSKNYSGIKGDNKNYRCVNGSWKPAELKWNPDNTDRGYCPEASQCYLDSSSCVDAGYFKGDNYCEEGNWSSRTKLVARQLLSIATETVADIGWDIKRATIYCDNYDQVLTQVDYVEATISPKSAKEIITGNNNCPGTTGLPCANNFCALTVVNDNGDEKIFLGTSMNIPVDTELNAPYSILNLFKEAISPAGSSHNTFCDYAIQLSNSTGNYTGCLYGSTAVSPNKANIWIDHRTQTLIYSKESFDIENTVTSSDVFNAFLRNPLKTIFSWARTWLFGQVQIMKGDSQFLESFADFRKLYISETAPLDSNNKEIRGVIEASTVNMMAVGYKNIEQNICYGMGIGQTTSCNFVINSSGFFQNIYSEDAGNWKDFTTNTRLEGTYTKGQLTASTVAITGPQVVLENESAVYSINVSEASSEKLIATSIDFGDGTAISIKGAPANGIWLVPHRFSNGQKTITAGILGENYKIKSEAINTYVLKPIQTSYSIKENTELEASDFTLDLLDYANYTVKLDSKPAWFSCNADLFGTIPDNTLSCSPEINKNELTDGTANFSIKIEISGTDGYIFNFSVHVAPVNTYPAFNETKLSEIMPSLVSDEDTPPSGNWTINLTQYAYDLETASSNLTFSVTGVTDEDIVHMNSFGCHIDINKVLECNKSEKDFNGNFSLRLNVFDSGEGSDSIKSGSAVITLKINQVNDAPVLDFGGNSLIPLQVYNSADLPYALYATDIETPATVQIRCEPIDSGSESIASISYQSTYLTIQAYGAADPILNYSIANYSCWAYDNDFANSPPNKSSERVNLSIKVTLFSGDPLLSVSQSSYVVNEGNSQKVWIKAAGSPEAIMKQPNNVTLSYKVLAPSGASIDMNMTDFGNITLLVGQTTHIYRNISGVLNTTSSSIDNNPTPSPGNNNIDYEIQFNVTDANNLSGYNIVNIMLNRKPAASLSIGGMHPQYGFRSVYNGSYIFNYSASDIDNLSSCIIYWGDGTSVNVGCSDVYYSSTISLTNSLHIYSQKKQYNVSFVANDSYGAYSNVTLGININDTAIPTATIIKLNVSGDNVSMNYSSADNDQAISYCGYFIDRNVSSMMDSMLWNVPKDGDNWQPLAECTSKIIINYPNPGKHNMTFFAVDTMGRMAYNTKNFTIT